MITTKDIETALFAWAPKELAADWDNVGHLIGDPSQKICKILISLDITESVIDEAISSKANLIISHHPIMNCTWHKTQNILTNDRQGKLLTKLIQNNISAICMHTNLDAAIGGVNDILAKSLKLEYIEMLSDDKIGRIGTTKFEFTLVEFIESVLKLLGCNGIRYTDAGKSVRRVAVGGGSCGSYIEEAIKHHCDTFVTSDLKYHDFLDYQSEINLIDAGHFPTENQICHEIRKRLLDLFPDLDIVLSSKHSKEIINYSVKGEK